MNKIRGEFMEEHLLTKLYYAEQRDEYKAEADELQQMYEQLSHRLDDEELQKQLFLFYDKCFTLMGLEMHRRYEQGFRRGIQLMTECLYLAE